MKLNKKTTTILSFMIGSVMFTTTAIAQVLTKSGYDQLKDSVKYTAESATTKLSSYTMDMSVILKDNNTVLYSTNSLDKVDVAKGAKENVSTRLEGSTKTENYNYNDKKNIISKNSEENIYYTSEITRPQVTGVSNNPFKEDRAADMEKIADALVGNLKDAVVVTQNPDGSKMLSGALNESQIPAIINAVVSLQAKSEFGNRANNPNTENNMPNITKDVFVKAVKGSMVTTKKGLIQSVLGSGEVSGKDDKGKEHKLTFELLAKMTNVNSTKVSRPDLSGKKVEKNIEHDYSLLTNPQKYMGTYKTNILIEKKEKFEKIGERIIDITAVDNKGISGRYYEEYAKGYEEYATNKKDFKFDAKFEKDQFNGQFNAVNSSKDKIKGNVSVDQGSAKIYLSTERSRLGNVIYDDSYSKVFK